MTEPRLPRRRIAYAATVAIITITAAAYKYPITEPNAGIVTVGLYVLGSAVLGYLGAQIAPDVFQRK